MWTIVGVCAFLIRDTGGHRRESTRQGVPVRSFARLEPVQRSFASAAEVIRAMSQSPSMYDAFLTTLRSTLGRFQRTRCEVRLLGTPCVGRPLVMFDLDDQRRVVTSRVVRLFEDARRAGTFVETQNTLYLVERTGHRDSPSGYRGTPLRRCPVP